MIARALAQGAPILLLDEPTTALDVGHQQEVLELVDRLRVANALTVVSTMHDLTLAGQYADRWCCSTRAASRSTGHGRGGADRGAPRPATTGPGSGWCATARHVVVVPVR